MNKLGKGSPVQTSGGVEYCFCTPWPPNFVYSSQLFTVQHFSWTTVYHFHLADCIWCENYVLLLKAKQFHWNAAWRNMQTHSQSFPRLCFCYLRCFAGIISRVEHHVLANKFRWNSSPVFTDHSDKYFMRLTAFQINHSRKADGIHWSQELLENCSWHSFG